MSIGYRTLTLSGGSGSRWQGNRVIVVAKMIAAIRLEEGNEGPKLQLQGVETFRVVGVELLQLFLCLLYHLPPIHLSCFCVWRTGQDQKMSSTDVLNWEAGEGGGEKVESCALILGYYEFLKIFFLICFASKRTVGNGRSVLRGGGRTICLVS